MKHLYIRPTVVTTAVETHTTLLQNVSFTVDTNSPRGGWADAKDRAEEEYIEAMLAQSENNGWDFGLW